VRSNFFGSVSVCMHPDGRLLDGAQAYLAGSSPECSLVPPRGVDSAANCDRLRREPITLEGPRNTGRDESEQLTHGFGWRLRRRRDAGALIRLARRKHLRPRPERRPR
jgi:hypothetical protein